MKTIDDIGKISDGYHTFDELYEHRYLLWIALCHQYRLNAWVSKFHSDGTSYDGYFLLGLFKEKGKQITYHLPNKYYQECLEFFEELVKAPPFDGHSSKDVLRRLENLIDYS